jgi:Ca-activated chloride channel family protein
MLCLAVPLALAPPAEACDLALVLLVDVSGSVDPREYDIQIDGLAAALRDGAVAEALVAREAALALGQWTGTGRQAVSIPWRRIGDFADVEAFADEVAATPRRWRNFSTALGEALALGERLLAAGPDCRRKVIDVSGDGSSNEGPPPAPVRDRLAAADVTVNALVITGSEEGVLPYFEAEVIGGPGAFALAADGYRAYPARIREKLYREAVRITADRAE